VYCKRCHLRLCTACYEGGHAGHAAHPYRPFNWSVRAPQHLGEELRAFAADALHALSAFVEQPR
jgi:hypothetical protein